MASEAGVEMLRIGGEGNGSIGRRLLANNMSADALRPFIGEDGNSYITVNQGTKTNPKYGVKRVDNAMLRQDEWRLIDEAVVRVSRPILQAVGDLRAAGLVKTLDGMSTPFYSYETIGDVTDAEISMNGLKESKKDRQELSTITMPLPIIHKDTSFDLRHLAQARRGGLELDMMAIEAMTRKVVEKAEQMLLGTIPAYYAGSGYVYGYRTHPNRVTKVLTAPTASGWTPQTLVDEVLDMRQSLKNKFRNGPYVLYFSTDWDKYLDGDYSSAYNGNTLRTRLAQITGITAIRSLDYLGTSTFQTLMVQMTSDVIREIVGMDVKAVQWEERGGMELFIKIMAILVPQVRIDSDSNCGIAHGTA